MKTLIKTLLASAFALALLTQPSYADERGGWWHHGYAHYERPVYAWHGHTRYIAYYEPIPAYYYPPAPVAYYPPPPVVYAPPVLGLGVVIR